MNSKSENLEHKLTTFLFSIIPATYLIGNAIYELNFILIIFFFLFRLQNNKELFNTVIQDKIFILLVILWIYLIINTFTGTTPHHSIQRNFLFVKFIILIMAIKYLIKDRGNINLIIKFWSLTLLVVSFDVFYEFIFGKNILGFQSAMLNERIVSFFQDELIVGSYLFGFSFPIIIYFINKKKFIRTLLISIIFILAILLSGERAIFFKTIAALSIFILFVLKNQKLKFFLSIFFLSMLTFLMILPQIKYRYFDTIKNSLNFQKNLDLKKNILNTKYINQAVISYELFKNHKLFGVGNKNYYISCNKELDKTLREKCYTHPHQTYYEFLSEHGLIGSMIIIFILFKLLFKNYKIDDDKYFNIEIFLKLYLIVSLLPIIPTGSFFGSYSMSLFWINYSFIHVYKNKLIK